MMISIYTVILQTIIIKPNCVLSKMYYNSIKFYESIASTIAVGVLFYSGYV